MNDPRAAVNLEAGTVTELASKHEALITALADLIWPVIRERIIDAIDARVNFKLENAIDDKITAAVEYGRLITEDDLDQRLADYSETSEVEAMVNDKAEEVVRDWVDSNLTDSVRDVLRNSVSLTIEVD